MAAAFLACGTPADLRLFLRFWDRISYPAWSHLEESLRIDTATPTELDAANRGVFLAGVEAITAGPGAGPGGGLSERLGTAQGDERA